MYENFINKKLNIIHAKSLKVSKINKLVSVQSSADTNIRWSEITAQYSIERIENNIIFTLTANPFYHRLCVCYHCPIKDIGCIELENNWFSYIKNTTVSVDIQLYDEYDKEIKFNGTPSQRIDYFFMGHSFTIDPTNINEAASSLNIISKAKFTKKYNFELDNLTINSQVLFEKGTTLGNTKEVNVVPESIPELEKLGYFNYNVLMPEHVYRLAISKGSIQIFDFEIPYKKDNSIKIRFPQTLLEREFIILCNSSKEIGKVKLLMPHKGYKIKFLKFQKDNQIEMEAQGKMVISCDKYCPAVFKTQSENYEIVLNSGGYHSQIFRECNVKLKENSQNENQKIFIESIVLENVIEFESTNSIFIQTLEVHSRVINLVSIASSVVIIHVDIVSFYQSSLNNTAVFIYQDGRRLPEIMVESNTTFAKATLIMDNSIALGNYTLFQEFNPASGALSLIPISYPMRIDDYRILASFSFPDKIIVSVAKEPIPQATPQKLVTKIRFGSMEISIIVSVPIAIMLGVCIFFIVKKWQSINQTQEESTQMLSSICF